MRMLITGGAGFIGSHTAEHCLQAGHEVRIVDDFSTGRKTNLAAVEKQVDLIEADILDFAALSAACRDIEVIIHLAAVSSVEKSIQDPLRTHAVNVDGSLNVLEAARRTHVRRIIFSSSAAVYGDEPGLPKKESSPVQPLSPYAWHKLSTEFYGKTYTELFGLEFAALRLFNVYGLRQDPASPYSGVLSIFVQRLQNQKPLIIFGDGLQTRDFIHVSDVARVILFAAGRSETLPPVMNVGTGIEISINDIAEIIGRAGKGRTEVLHEPDRAGDIHRSFADISLLEKIYGSRAWVDIRDGLEKLMRG